MKNRSRSFTRMPLSDAVASFQLLIHHDCQGGHLHRMGIFVQPTCSFCEPIFVSAGHFLVTTPNSSDIGAPENFLGNDFSHLLYLASLYSPLLCSLIAMFIS
ncbi:hypothetical protein TNCV_1619341 [Trichonephila clavipes]|nr:hypothetical protein TNCV_1619341 [Trichonephila clavipes]